MLKITRIRKMELELGQKAILLSSVSETDNFVVTIIILA